MPVRPKGLDGYLMQVLAMWASCTCVSSKKDTSCSDCGGKHARLKQLATACNRLSSEHTASTHVHAVTHLEAAVVLQQHRQAVTRLQQHAAGLPCVKHVDNV